MANDIQTEPVTESPDLAKEFAELAATWRRERGPTSKIKTMTAHPAYRKIVAMGERVVPMILADLEKKPDHWYVALHEITGAHPVSKEDAGLVEIMAAAWIAWGREQGHRW